MKQKPLFIRGFGIYCSSSSSYNPKIIEVLYKRKNKEKYSSLGNFKLSLSFGTQILTTEEILFNNIEKIKFVIKETYGGKQTYINNIFLYENLPNCNLSMEYQDEDKNINEESNIHKNITNNSNKLNLKDLNLNEITNNKKEKIINNNLPTGTTDILLTESDLTEKPKKKQKKYYSNTKNEKIDKNIEKNNKSNILEKEGIIEENISIESHKKDNSNNSSNIILTNSDDNNEKNNAIEENNIINTISDNSHNNKIKNNDIIQNKINEYDLRVSNLENEVNSLKDVINEILNNLNEIINQNKNHSQECKKYIDYKILSSLENINNKIYYYNTQSFNQNYSNNSKYIETQNLNNASEIICNNISRVKSKNGNINKKALYFKKSKSSKAMINNNEKVKVNNKNNFKKEGRKKN